MATITQKKTETIKVEVCDLCREELPKLYGVHNIVTTDYKIHIECRDKVLLEAIEKKGA